MTINCDQTQDSTTFPSFSVLPASMSYDRFVELMEKFDSGKGSVAEALEGFEQVVRDAQYLKVELFKQFTVKKLETLVRPAYAGMKKDRLVELLLDRMVTQFAFLAPTGGCVAIQGYTWDDRVSGIRRKYLCNISEASLTAFAEGRAAQKADRQKRLKSLVDATTDPSTLADFEIFVRVKGEKALTPELVARRDALIAEKSRLTESNALAGQAIVKGVSVPSVADVIPTKHTTKGHDLFVVRLQDRVERAVFDQLNVACKKLFGYYSSYSKGGAVPGFQFASLNAAQQFVQIAKGESVDRTELFEDKSTGKVESASERLDAMADRLEEAAQSSLSKVRLTNTHRRAGMASSADAESRRQIALARTIRNLSTGLRDGTANYLDKIRHKVQVEYLENTLKQAWSRQIYEGRPDHRELEDRKSMPIDASAVSFAQWPAYRMDAGMALRLKAALALCPNTVRLCKSVELLRQSGPRVNDWISVDSDLAEAIMAKLEHSQRDLPHFWPDVRAQLGRLSAMGVTRLEELRVVLREYLSFRGEAMPVDKVKEMERALVGQKVGVDFFPTPMEVAGRMLAIAKGKLGGFKPGMVGYDPEAGSGHLAEVMRGAGLTVHVGEISSALRDLLKAKSFELVSGDFMDHESDQRYDLILQNPPFGNCADIHHVMKAVEFLKPNAPLVAIVGEGAFIRSGRVETAFRDWLEIVGAEVEKLPQGTFEDRTLLATTGANARLVTIVNTPSLA